MTGSGESRLRFGILGCGSAARRLFIPGLIGSQRAALSAVAAKDPRRARSFAEESGCGWSPSYEALLAREDVDVVYVSLPIALHAEWAIRALEAGKHVYCEKSLAPSLPEAESILACADKRGRRVMEGFMYRFHPLFRSVQQALSGGELGRLRSFVGSFGFTLPPGDALRRDPGMGMGALNETGCYPVSAARLLFGGIPRSVFARLDSAGGIDRSGSVLLGFASGDAYCDFGYDRAYRCDYTLWGTMGRLWVDRAFTTPPDLEPVIHLSLPDGPRERRVAPENHFSRAIDAFCSAILSGGDREVFECDARDQAIVMEALRVSARESRPVEPAAVGARA